MTFSQSVLEYKTKVPICIIIVWIYSIRLRKNEADAENFNSKYNAFNGIKWIMRKLYHVRIRFSLLSYLFFLLLLEVACNFSSSEIWRQTWKIHMILFFLFMFGIFAVAICICFSFLQIKTLNPHNSKNMFFVCNVRLRGKSVQRDVGRKKKRLMLAVALGSGCTFYTYRQSQGNG